MIRLIFSVYKINIRDTSILEYLPVFLVSLLLIVDGKAEFLPLSLALLASKYCSQFKNLLDPYFIKLTGFRYFEFVFTSNFLIYINTTVTFCITLVISYFILFKSFNINSLHIFLSLNFFALFYGNIVSWINKQTESRIISAFLSTIFLSMLFGTWYLLNVLSGAFFIVAIIAVAIWGLQLLIIAIYDFS